MTSVLRRRWTDQALRLAGKSEELLLEAGRPVMVVELGPLPQGSGELLEVQGTGTIQAAAAYASLAQVYATLAVAEPQR